MNSQGRIITTSTYPQSPNSDLGDYCWLPTLQYRPDLFASDTGIINQQPAVSNSRNNPVTTCTDEGENVASCWDYHGNEPNATVGNQQLGSKSLPEKVWPPPHHPPNSTVSVVRVDLMTVEQTAAWIRTLSLFNGWEEAYQYSQSFKKNNICGHLLWKLTLDSLKFDLGIEKYGHRMKIKVAIKHLYPHLFEQDCGVESKMIDDDRCAMSDTISTTESGRSEGFSLQIMQTPKSFSSQQTPKTFSPVLFKTNKDDFVFPSVDRSPSCKSQVKVSSCASTLRTDDQNKKVLKTIEKSMTPASNLETRPTMKFSKTVKWQIPKATPTEALSFSVTRKSTRARPDNPLQYKTLRNAKIRSGKSVRTEGVGYLPKGSVVIINQIKGRSGRVVHPHGNGEFIKVGWVTLYTHDGQQLLEKVTCKRATLRTKA